MEKLSIVVPFYNEQEMCSMFFDVLFKTLNEIKTYEIEVVAVNDGSSDNTLDILKSVQKEHKNIKIINLSRNFGHEHAIHAGLSNTTGDAIIPMDGDLQDPPEVILKLLEKYEEGFDIVNAKRKSRKKDSFLKKFTASLYYKLIGKWSGKIKVPDNVGHFRLISRSALNEVLALSEVNRVFRSEVPFVGFKTTFIEFDRPERAKGTTHYNYKSMIDLAADSIVSTSYTPLRLILKTTLFISIITFLSCLTELVLFILARCDVLFITSASFSMWLIINIVLIALFILMFSLSIMSEYIGKTFLEAQDRPFYIIKDIISSEDNE